MEKFKPIRHVENSYLIIDNGSWPNFHDAEVHRLSIWRGDIRPEDNVWIGPVIEVKFELCALKDPYIVDMKFHDCESIQMEAFNHQNALYDLAFKFEHRGMDLQGNPLTPYIAVRFEQAFGAELSFKCFRVQALGRNDLEIQE